MSIRIGHGFDVHAFGPGDHVILGGARIPCDAGLIAHSDGDVLLHALCDALLGAEGLGDIGRHFPDTEATWENADSRVLLGSVAAMLRKSRRRVTNVDCTVIAAKPRLAPHVGSMVAHIAADLDLPEARVNVKATTTEGLGPYGRGEGIAAHVVVVTDRL
jgi:2-C-methyl-D-erythritol 2,4-cyclodiphosphate synthase